MLSKKVFDVFKNTMPIISKSEYDALAASDVSWEQKIFTGKINWVEILNYETSVLNRQEQKFIDGQVQQFCEMISDYRINNIDHDLSPSAWKFLKDHGFFGLTIPREYGGLGFSNFAHAMVITKLASKSMAAAVTVMTANSLAPSKLLLNYGTKLQRDHYLPLLAKGTEISCFDLTNPTAGSDASSILDWGAVCFREVNGETILGVKLNWEKRFITLSPVATLINVAFKLYDPDHILGNKEYLGITLALVPANSPGVIIGDKHNPLGIGFMNGPNWGIDVFVPMDSLIGGKKYIGQGWKMLNDCLMVNRGVAVPSLSVGVAKMATNYIGAYARIREQFKLPIGKFEGVEEVLARIAGYTYMIDATERLTLSTLDHNVKPSILTSMVKYHVSELANKVLTDSMYIQGGSGICLGNKNPIGEFYKGIPITAVMGGSNILLRSMVIFGQGAMRSHPFVMDEIKAIQNDDLIAFQKVFRKHLWYTTKNTISASFHSWTNGLFLGSRVWNNYLVDDMLSLSILVKSFALVSDVALIKLGGKLKHRERLSARLGDIMCNLYMVHAIIKKWVDDKCPEADLPLVQWSIETLLYNAEQSLNDFLDNFGFTGSVLRFLVLPKLTRKKPRDGLDHILANLVMTSGRTRDRLTSGIFISVDKTSQMRLADDLLDILNGKTNNITKDDIVALQRKFIKVDQFKKI